MAAEHATAALRFEHFELQPHERRLIVRGEPVAVGSRAFDLLLALAEQPGRLQAKDALLERVWPGLVVEENNLAVHVSQLRKLIGTDAIATIPGRGYRFTARPAGADDAVPARPAPAPPPGEPPLAATPLVGRERELDELEALVQAHALVTVVGAGGMGKSRLAQALLARRRTAHAHGVCWVELAEVQGGAALPAALASALGLGAGSAEALAAALAPLDLLLVLDGAEPCAAEVAALLPSLQRAAPGLRLLVTSQAPLELPGECLLRLGPLALPDDAPDAAQALGYGAVALFVARARAAGARLATDDAGMAATVELCRMLDGMPLALELAAARVPALGVPTLARSMQDRLALLTHSRNRHAPPRQQTLRATLEWSHALLGEPERVVFRRLAVVAGSASLDTVLALAAEPEGGLDGMAVLDALASLVDRSLVCVLDVAPGRDATPRYRLLDSPRAFALERLREAGEEPALRRRHALALAAAFDAAYDGYYQRDTGWADWSHRLAADLDNARDALAWALAAGDALSALQIAPTLMRALPPAQLDARRALAGTLQALAEAPAPVRLQQRAWFQIATWWGGTQRQRSHAATARVLALARGLEAGADAGFTLYNALCARARSAARVGELALAAEALAEAQTLEDADWPAQRLYWRVEAEYFLACARGDAAAALEALRRTLALADAAGSDNAVMRANMIDAELAQGHAEAAARQGRALVAQLEGTRCEHDLAFARVNLLAALLALEDTAAARALAQRGWPQGRRFDLQPYWADYLSLLAALEGRLRSAARLAGHADAAYARRGEARAGNEAIAAARVRSLLGGAHAALRDAGAALAEDELAALAFATDDC